MTGKPNIDDALYVYALFELGYKDEFDSVIVSAVNEGAGTGSFINELYMELDSERGLHEVFEDKLDHCLKHKEYYTKEWYQANLRLNAFFRSLLEKGKTDCAKIAEDMGRISLISGCSAYATVAGCYSEVAGMSLMVLDQALSVFLATGRFVYGRYDSDLADDKPDPYKNLVAGKQKEAAMGVIDDRMTAAFGKDIKLTVCWGPVQMCVFRLEYDYRPLNYNVVFECERGIILGYIINGEGKAFNPTQKYPGENYYHSVHIAKELDQMINIVIRAVNEKPAFEDLKKG